MKLKYYLRGLGIGILMTLLLMGVSGRKHTESLSEDQIRQEAYKLGMVDGTNVLVPHDAKAGGQDDSTETLQKQEASALDEPSFDAADEPTGTDSEGNEKESGGVAASVTEDASVSADLLTGSGNTTTDSQTAGTTETAKDAGSKNGENRNGTSGETSITITIESGDKSHTVAEKLANAGLVESSQAYDQFLYQNGYDKKLRAGSYVIPAGADEAEIAMILTGGN